MVVPPKYGNLDQVPIRGHTKEWFIKDLETIKNSAKTTFFNIHWIALVHFLITILINLIFYKSTSIGTNLYIGLISLPLSLFGFFILHVMLTKGYNISFP